MKDLGLSAMGSYSTAERQKILKDRKAQRKKAARNAKEAMDEARGRPLPKKIQQKTLTGEVIEKNRKLVSLLRS